MITATKAKAQVRLVWEPINKAQDDFVASLASRCLFSGAFGAGKALTLDTLIAISSGWATMGTIEVGDFAFDDRGLPTRVVFKSDIMTNHQLYRVTFDDGSFIKADADHLWHIFNYKDRAKRRVHPPEGHILTTKQLTEKTKLKCGVNYAIRCCLPLQLPDAKLPVDPYTLGIWLGDGSSYGGQITTNDDEIVKALEWQGFSPTKDKAPFQYSTHGLVTTLRKEKLVKNKHIPKQYLRASESQRRLLLMGLMDTDGYCAGDGACEFTNTNKDLAEGVYELATSLGIKATFHERVATLYGRYISQVYDVAFTTNHPVFRLAYKAHRQVSEVRPTQRWHYITSIEPIQSEPVQCIQVDSPSHLYLAGKALLPTHNTIALCAKGLKLSLDYPKNYGLICRKVRATLGQTTLKTFMERVCPMELIKDYNKSEGLVTLTNGSQILFGGLDDPLKLGSLELGWVGIDEAIETVIDDWRMLEGRLRLPGVPHQIFAATNPGPPSHYLYRMFLAESKGDVYQSSSFDNPVLPEDYKQRLREFEGVYRDRYVLGLWKGLEGLVYSAFDEKTCLIPRFEVDKAWLVHSGHDFGLANPAALFYTESPGTGDFYAFQEYMPGAGMGIYDHVQAFKTIAAGCSVIKRVGGSHQEGEIRQGYTSQGWPIAEPKYSKDRPFQIKQVQGMHRLNKVYIFNDLANYIREKFSFVYKKDTDIIENEARFHCLIAGTKIRTSEGEKSIEDIKSGDLVATRQGYYPVRSCGLTKSRVTVYEVSFSDGSKLVGTAEHPIFVNGRGFVPLTALRYGDIMEVWKEKQLSTEGLNITATPTPKGVLIEFILSQQKVISTVLCGKMLMGRYLRVALFIIKTLTHPIMNYLTLKAVKGMASICQSISGGVSMTLNIFGEYHPSLLLAGNYGRQQLKGSINLVSVPNNNGETKCQSLKSAFVAGRITQQLNRHIVSSVAPIVNPHIGGQEFVPDNDLTVLGIGPAGKASVYNLSVQIIPEYYANNILVHNCMAAERYLLSDFTPETVVAGGKNQIHRFR